MIRNLPEDAKIEIAAVYAAGSADRSALPIIDTDGFDAATFVIVNATFAASSDCAYLIHHGDASDLADAVAVEGATKTGETSTDSDKVRVIHIRKLTKRYLRLVVDNDGTNSTAQSAVCVLGLADRKPVTQTAADVEVVSVDYAADAA